MKSAGADGNEDTVCTYTGRRYTLRGAQADPDATVWQLRCDDDYGIYDFLYDPEEQTLTMLGKWQ